MGKNKSKLLNIPIWAFAYRVGSPTSGRHITNIVTTDTIRSQKNHNFKLKLACKNTRRRLKIENSRGQSRASRNRSGAKNKTMFL